MWSIEKLNANPNKCSCFVMLIKSIVILIRKAFALQLSEWVSESIYLFVWIMWMEIAYWIRLHIHFTCGRQLRLVNVYRFVFQSTRKCTLSQHIHFYFYFYFDTIFQIGASPKLMKWSDFIHLFITLNSIWNWFWIPRDFSFFLDAIIYRDLNMIPAIYLTVSCVINIKSIKRWRWRARERWNTRVCVRAVCTQKCQANHSISKPIRRQK